MYSYTRDGVERSELFFWRGRDVRSLDFLTWRFDLSQLLMQMPQALAAPDMFAQSEEVRRRPPARVSARRHTRTPRHAVPLLTRAPPLPPPTS